MVVCISIQLMYSYSYRRLKTLLLAQPAITPWVLMNCPPPRISKDNRTISSGVSGRPLWSALDNFGRTRSVSLLPRSVTN